MDMDGWRDNLHFDFHGEHVLFAGLRLSSTFNFFIASLLTIFLCLLEKCLTYALSSKWNPLPSRNSRMGNAAFRAAVYWILTFVRLLYMLLAMTFHVGLIVVAVTTLSAGEFVIEYLETPHPYAKPHFADGVPLLTDDRRDFIPSQYHDALVTSTNGTPTTARYPPRRKLEEPLAAADGTTVFTIDDREDDA